MRRAAGRYYPALDGLRGWAVLAVLFYHLGPPWLRGGLLGVDVFFTLSGFLITAILLGEWEASGNIRFARFYARRALRLLPALVGMLAVARLLAPHFAPAAPVWQEASLRNAGAALFYAANWVRAFSPHPESLGPIAHTWSLSIEEQFYLLWPPLLAFLLARRSLRRRHLLLIVLAGILVSAGLRLVYWRAGFSMQRLYNGSDTHADGLLAGCLIALIPIRAVSGRAAFWLRGAALGAAVFVLAQFFVLDGRSIAPSNYLAYNQAYLLTVLAVAVLLFALTRGVRLPVVSWALENRPLIWVGRLSYSLYLFHMLVYMAPWPGWAAAAVGVIPGAVVLAKLGLSLLLACASYYGVERPFLTLKARFAARYARRRRFQTI